MNTKTILSFAVAAALGAVAPLALAADEHHGHGPITAPKVRRS